MTTQLKRAATILIIRDGKILAVSRKDNSNDWGLPGGKCEDGESFEAAATRELLEETGFLAANLEFVFERQDKDYIVQTFIPGRYSGTIITSEEGKVDWISAEELISGSFGEYNLNLLRKVGFLP